MLLSLSAILKRLSPRVGRGQHLLRLQRWKAATRRAANIRSGGEARFRGLVSPTLARIMGKSSKKRLNTQTLPAWATLLHVFYRGGLSVSAGRPLLGTSL